MRFTKHADIRKKQRGFSRFITDVILQFGAVRSAAGGAVRIFLGNREYQEIVGELKRAIQLLDKAKGSHIIIQGDNVLTVYK